VTSPSRALASIAGIVLALSTAVALQAARDGAYPREDRAADQLLYVHSGQALDRIALEFDALASDVYWIRAIQHYGGQRLAAPAVRNYAMLDPLLDLTTSLDPYFTIAYRFGAIFLSEAAPGGPGRPDRAIALLEKGIAAQPHKWQYFHDIAFVHYWHMRDAVGAATWFQRAAEQPGAPNWLGPLAATMVGAKDRRAARFLWEEIRGSDQPWLQRTAERSLQQLDALDQIDALQRMVDGLETPAGRRVTWSDLVRRRLLSAPPVDPSGEPYVLDPDTARVQVSPQSTLNPMPDPLRAIR
jgi:hypothetical protein